MDGAFVEFLPGKEGLVHISRMSKERVEKVSDVVQEGQEVQVKLFEIDRMGRLNLTMVDLPDEQLQRRAPAGPPRDRDSRDRPPRHGGMDREERPDRPGRSEGRPRRR